MSRAKAAEKIAQLIYDLRDSTPAANHADWSWLDDCARSFSEYRAELVANAIPKRRTNGDEPARGER